MQKSHAIANGIYVVAVNRVGTEKKGGRKIQFWGNSMIINPIGLIIIEFPQNCIFLPPFFSVPTLLTATT